jgi:hypothetical protein
MQMLHEIEAHSTKTQSVQPAQLGIFDGDGQQGNAQIGAALGHQRVLHHAVVRAVQGRLHNHATLDAKHGMQGE